MMFHNSRGASLLELITVILILGLLGGICIPSFSKMLMRQERENTLNMLKTSIEYAKNEAFRRGKIITICLSTGNQRCVGIPGSEVIVFENNENRSQPQPGSILQIFGGLHYGELRFRAFGDDHTTLNIQSNGMTYNNGTFSYCPKNSDRRDADGLIINNASRIYRLTERNTLGVLFGISCW